MTVAVRLHRCVQPGRMQAGVTLLELLVTIAIVAIIFAVAGPSTRNLFDSKRLVAAAEQVYGHLQQARLESIARSTPVRAHFSANGSATWAYGVSHRDLCDITQTGAGGVDACVMVVDDGDGAVDPGDGSVDPDDLVLMRFDDSDHPDVTMNIASFSSGNSQISFDPIRGTATGGEVILMSPLGRQLKVKVGLLGQLRICSPDGSVLRYSDTGC